MPDERLGVTGQAECGILTATCDKIRDPMNRILGMTEVLLNGDLSPQQRQCLETILKSGEEALSVVNDAIDLARIAAGKLCLLLHKVTSLGMVADTALSGEGALALYKAHHYDVILVDEEMPGMDGVALAQAITDAGGDVDRLVMLTAFPEGENRTRAISAGVRWFLTKPVRQDLHLNCIASVAGVQAEEKEPAAEDPLPGLRPSPHILVVDDNAINREVCTGMLVQLGGYEVSVAVNGREALEKLDRHCYDLILMDCQMPEMDGYQATACIRGRQRPDCADGMQARLPIIAMTAYAHLEDREHCLAAGMDDYLAKPFTKEQLGGVLHRWLPKKIVDRA